MKIILVRCYYVVGKIRSLERNRHNLYFEAIIVPVLVLPLVFN